ncbi:response regulator [Aquabacterium sp.]|uniref:response regulator n=1 Tax=Aquabacterium sp. TaxID=1872578 RepID=UPI0019BB8BD6|nr:response regulator [Aquabacterium sp.]MBC7700561.1 response regulator [Aquabacterium sp.]
MEASARPLQARPPNTDKRWWVLALLWTALVGGGAFWLIQDDIDDHRAEQLQSSRHRLDSLSDSLTFTFQQLQALPRALGRQIAVHQFLQYSVIENSATLTEDDRLALQTSLSKRNDVREISQLMRQTADDFHIHDIYLIDRFGTVVANARLKEKANVLGANFKTRRYFNDTLESGSGTQFAVGRITRIPGFYFATRVDQNDATAGVIVVKQNPDALQRLFDDPQRLLFITDAQGVVLVGNPAIETLKRVPMQGPLTMEPVQAERLYMRKLQELPWTTASLQVNDQNITQVTIKRQPYLAQQQPLAYGGLTAWTLTPLQNENTTVASWLAGAALVLVSGYWTMAHLRLRSHRLHELTQAQTALRNMAHALPLVVFRYEQPAQGRGHFTFIGQGLKSVLGVDSATLLDDPELPWRLAGQDSLQPPNACIEFPITLAGKNAWVRCEGTPTRHDNGDITYNGYWQDATDQKQAQARSEAVFNHAPLGFLFFDEQQHIIRANAAAIAMFGASSEQALLGLQPSAPPLSPPIAKDNLALQQSTSAILQKISQREIFRFEWRHTRLDGEQFDAEMVVIPFEDRGQRQLCTIMQDITPRKKAESAMREAKLAAEAAMHAKSRFLANMSHEIRTPMNAVMGMTHLALMEDLSSRARNYVEKAHRAAGNLLQVLNDILDVSKIESGKLTLESANFQLEQVVNNMADVLGMKAEEKGLELLFTADPDIPTSLVGDPMRLGQILINLGTNAIKFTERGDVLIGVEVRRLEADRVELHFWVRDTGIGMSTELLGRLFQPFTQGDSSTTRQYGGTGLGLTISRQLVEMMGGKIWVDSQVGRGSTFHFTTRFGLQSQALPRRALLASELQGRRVLLVDDNATAREVLGDMMRRLGLNVEVASGGEQALQSMREAQQAGQSHHLLLTDWKMPGMDGIAFARQALSLPPEHRPCVLLVTAFGRDEALRAAEGVGLEGVLNKPVTPSTLHDSISRALGQHVDTPTTAHYTSKVLEVAQRQLAGARLLLVEDQPLNQELACDLLERAGIQVVTALNGREALDKLEHGGQFGGVVMDCQMPVMDGYTATERIRARPEWQNLPIIAMTASAMASDRDRVLQSGMNDHITKPLDLGQMFNIMARWIVPAHPAANPKASNQLHLEKAHGLNPEAALITLDTADGIARCMGNLDLYRRLIKGFDKTQQDFGPQFSHALREQDHELVLRMAHTLKGLAGNIGAMALQHAASELESACQTGAEASGVAAALAQTLSALTAVRTDIRALVQPAQTDTQDASQMLRDPAIRGQWPKLSQLIDDNDAQAQDLIQDMVDGWPGLTQLSAVRELCEALSRYDFDAASTALKSLRQAA